MDFQIRDIRRTVATRMAEDLGITPFVIAKVMDHKLPGEAEMGKSTTVTTMWPRNARHSSSGVTIFTRLVRKSSRPGLRLVRSALVL